MYWQDNGRLNVPVPRWFLETMEKNIFCRFGDPEAWSKGMWLLNTELLYGMIWSTFCTSWISKDFDSFWILISEKVPYLRKALR